MHPLDYKNTFLLGAFFGGLGRVWGGMAGGGPVIGNGVLSVAGTAYETLLMTTASAGASVGAVLANGKDGGNKGSSKVSDKTKKAANTIKDKASNGNIKYDKEYHGRLDKNLEREILYEPDAIYVTDNKKQNLVYRKGDNVVIVESSGSSRGNVITSHGPDGPRGKSGANIFGGSPSDSGMPVTHEDIISSAGKEETEH